VVRHFIASFMPNMAYKETVAHLAIGEVSHCVKQGKGGEFFDGVFRVENMVIICNVSSHRQALFKFQN
jgi:hypothetical protein